MRTRRSSADKLKNSTNYKTAVFLGMIIFNKTERSDRSRRDYQEFEAVPFRAFLSS